nr:AT-rich interactive domain-containing protein 3C isoform X2 [Hydra vulgaris]
MLGLIRRTFEESHNRSNYVYASRISNDGNTSLDDLKKEDMNDSSVHSYHMWLKERQNASENNKSTENTAVKEDEDDDSGEENFRVDAVLERGPSPPESENSNSYEWSYEEQFKQLYEIDNEPERKTFLDEYFEFMKSRTTPVSRIPIMAKQILDLYQLYNLVVKHGGLVQVIRNKQWSKITKGLNLPTSITSAAFTLRTQYLKYLYAYECTMHNLSTPKELQAAIDSNRRDRFSTLYHSEPTMTPNSRDERFTGYPVNGCEYPVTQQRHHVPPHPVLGSQIDMRYGLKRHSDALTSKPFDKYMDSPKVIVLQDGNPSMNDTRDPRDPRANKLSPPPSFHHRSRSPSHENEMRTLARHVLEEETRRRLICKDKNCNGFDCQYPRQDFHRPRGHNENMLNTCTCAYCKDYTSGNNYSTNLRDLSRHHMDGASANHDATRSHLHTSPRGERNFSSIPTSVKKDDKTNDNETMTTLKIKLPNLRKGGTIQISLEVEGVLYEGLMSAKTVNNKTSPSDNRNEPNENS